MVRLLVLRRESVHTEGPAGSPVPDHEMRLRLLLGGVGGGDLCGSVRIFLREALDAACRIDQLLFAGEEGMAVRADFDAQHIALNGRACWKSIAASTMYGYLVIVGVNTGFHGAPVCRVRSARLPGWGTTAASLGRETIFDYTRRAESFKTGIPWCDGVSKPATLFLRPRSYNRPLPRESQCPQTRHPTLPKYRF